MIRRGFLAILGAALLLLALSASALAWPADVEGGPDQEGRSEARYYLWHHEGWHLRTHGPGEQHLFTARLHTDGTFVVVEPVHLENRLPGNLDVYAVTQDGHTLLLRFHTYAATDGVDFRIDGGSYLRFNLRLDGEPIDTEMIYLGHEGSHPESNPFTIHR